LPPTAALLVLTCTDASMSRSETLARMDIRVVPAACKLIVARPPAML
jgi:hypothetical protein